MADNFAEATTHVQYSPGTATTDYYYYLKGVTDLNLSDLDTDEEQLEVFRIFDYDNVSELLASPPSSEEINTLYILPALSQNGSSMYTVDTVNKKISFSTEAADYVWLNGTHHDRGADIQLTVVEHVVDTVIIRRRSVSARPKMIWTVGTKVTARTLNVQGDQLINLMQELRTFQLNPILFNYSIGTKSVICPLEPIAVIPLNHIH